MLAAIAGVQVVAGFFLASRWGHVDHSAVLLFLFAGWALWLFLCALRGRIPIPVAAPAYLFSVAVVGAGTFLWVHYPFHSYRLVLAEMTAGLALIPLVSLLGTPEREWLEKALMVLIWPLILLAVHVRLHGVPLVFLSDGILANLAFVLLSLTVRRGHILLISGLLIVLWWSRSVGVGLGLCAALLSHRKEIPPVGSWLGLALGATSFLVYGLAIYWHMPTPSMRVPYFGLWILLSIFMLKRSGFSHRFGPIAVVTQGMIDGVLGVPAVYWLYCLSLAWDQPQSDAAVDLRPRSKILLGAMSLAVAVTTAYWAMFHLRYDF